MYQINKILIALVLLLVVCPSLGIAYDSAYSGAQTDQAIANALAAGTINGLIKADGANNLSVAVAGTDYLAPSGNGSSLTGITWSQIGSTPTTLAGYGITDAESGTSNDFDPDRLAGDTSDDNLIDAGIIAAAIARDSELHDAVTIAGGITGLTLSTQEISLHAYIEDIAEFTDPNADRLWAWDDSADVFTGIIIGSGLTLTDVTLSADGGGSGDVTDVGDCASGACLDGSSDGGSYVRIYDGDSHYLEINPGDLTANRAIAFRDAAGTVILSGDTLTGDVTATLDSDGSTATTIAADSVALSTDTTGNYVATVADSGSSTITVSGSGSEGAAVTLDIADGGILEVHLNATNAPTDNYILSYNAAGGNYTWVQAGTGSGDLLADGTIPLTANWDVGAYTVTGLRFVSDQTTGTAPFTVASTTVVTNLNADLLDGESASAFEDADAAIAKTDEAETITANWTFDDGTGDSPSLTFIDETNETAVIAKVDSGYLGITTQAADGLNILTGNLKVGNGTPDQTMNGEDAYIEGSLEVDGVLYVDGGIVSASATDPYIQLDVTDPDDTDWVIGTNADADASSDDNLEFRTSTTPGSGVIAWLEPDTGNFGLNGTIYLSEQADADADVAGYGQIWVNTATPNELYFTDDAGTDHQLGTGSGDLLADGTIPLTANWDVGAYTITGLRFVSDQTTGTAPFTVASTTVVTNLNADTVDGESASEIVTAARVGGASANLDNTDASIEWEDAADLGATGALSADVVAAEEMADADHGDVSWTSGVATVDAVSGANSVDSDAYVDGSVDPIHLANQVRSEFIPIGWFVFDGTTDPGDETEEDNIRYRDFDTTTAEEGEFIWKADEDLTGSTIKVRAIAVVTNATTPADTEGVSWGIAACSSGTNDTHDCTVGGEVNSEDTDLDDDAGTQWDIIVFPYVEVTPTDLAAGELVKIAVQRDTADTDDDYGQDIGLIGVDIKYQTNPGTMSY